MTVPATPRIAGPYTGDAAATSFPFGFKVFAKTDVRVAIYLPDGTAVVPVLDGNYAVVLNVDQANSPGGTITYPISGAALPVGATLTIVGALPFDQTTSLPPGGNFSARVIENALDRTQIQMQQLAEAQSRAFTFPLGEGAIPEFPPVAARAGKLLGFDSNGQFIGVIPSPDSAIALALSLISSSGSSNVGFLQAGGGAVSRTMQSKQRDVVSVLDFGADPTGVLDSTSAINAALAAHKLVMLPPGVYKTSAAIVVPPGHRLIGYGRGGASVLKPVGTFDAAVKVEGPTFVNWANGSGLGHLVIDCSAYTGIGLRVRYCGLKCHFHDLYIVGVQGVHDTDVGVGIYREGFFDHSWERVEVRVCASYGIHDYEKQQGPDGVYEECSKVVNNDVHVIECNAGGTQWMVDGGDTMSYNDCKPSQGAVGIQFRRNGFAHRIKNLMYDALNAGTGVAIQTTADFVNDLQIDGVHNFQGSYSVEVLRGRNIKIDNIDAPVHVGPLADGAVFLGPGIDYTDDRTIPMTYPTNYRGTYTPTLNGGGSVGNGVFNAAAYTVNGDDVVFTIQFTVGSTTVLPNGAGFTPPFTASPAVTSVQCNCFQNSTGKVFPLGALVIAGNIVIGNGSGYLGPTLPFNFVPGDYISVSGSYKRA